MGTSNRLFFYRFGPFCLSGGERVLRRDGQAANLGPKAVDTLLVLIQNRHRVVPREELMKEVWPDSVVEENNLDQQIAALRKVLGKDAIENVPRRGYRFLLDVREEHERPQPEGRKRFWLIVAATIAMALVGGWLIRSRTASQRSVPSSRYRQAVVVLGFKNLSGGQESAWLSTGLEEMVRAELSAAKNLRTISGEETARAKIDLSLPDADSLSLGTLAAIRKRLNADLAVLGSYAVIGQGLTAPVRLDIAVQNTGSGEVTVSVTRTSSQASLPEVIASIGTTLRKELGEKELTATEAQALRTTYPPSLEVERLYAEGLGKLRLLNAVSARPVLEKALETEPGYALAYSALADCWSILGYQQKAKEAATKAFDRASGLPRESFLLLEGQYRELMNEWERAIQIYRALWTFFPDETDYGLRLANAQTNAGKGKDALVTIQELRKTTGADDPRVDLAEAATAEALGDFRREQTVASEARKKAEARRTRLVAAAAWLRESWAENQMGDRKPALEAAQQAKAIYVEVGDHAGEARAWKNIADVLDDEGDSMSAKGAYERALSIFREVGHEAAVSATINNLAYGLMDRGDLNGARKMFEESAGIGRKIADRAREAIALNGVANVLWRQGDLNAALAVYQNVVTIHREHGDKARTATVLGNVAIVLQDQGHLDEAKAKFEESLDIIRQIGDKPGLARTLGNLGELLLKQGDVTGAKKRFEEHLSVAEQMDDNRQRGYAFFGLGEALMAGGDLSGARSRYEDALAVRTKMNAKSVMAESQLALAGLALEEGKFGEAVQRARDARAEFHREHETDQEALAIAIEARGLSAQGKLSDAARAAKPLGEQLPKIQDRAERLAVLATAAPVMARAGTVEAVKAELVAAESEAAKFGYGALRLEILLAQSEVERNPVTAAHRLEAIEREAKAKGLGLISQKAAERLRSASK
ncbi:MAG: tetratricopeptide repeat protein [Acidobacteria bacterium]|nr:tetratricopeptide repeat protein [Acidobacteriota bacterium]